MANYLLLIALLTSLTSSAQKQTYFLFAWGQKNISSVCGEKILIKQEEVSLMPAEAIGYRSKVVSESKATYGEGYKNIDAELVPFTKAIICFEAKRVYSQQRDGWDCTSTFYGCVEGEDMQGAEKAFASLQTEFKNVTYKEIRRWGRQAILSSEAPGEKDLEVKWIAAPKGYLLNLKNTLKDGSLTVTIVSYKRKAGNDMHAGQETDLSKMTKSDEMTITLEPGMKSQNVFPKADGYEIRIKAGSAATKEEQEVIDQTRELIRSYITCPHYKCEIKNIRNVSGGGVRG